MKKFIVEKEVIDSETIYIITRQVPTITGITLVLKYGYRGQYLISGTRQVRRGMKVVMDLKEK